MHGIELHVGLSLDSELLHPGHQPVFAEALEGFLGLPNVDYVRALGAEGGDVEDAPLRSLPFPPNVVFEPVVLIRVYPRLVHVHGDRHGLLLPLDARFPESSSLTTRL